MIKKIDKSYIAGLIDGEGYIGICKSRAYKGKGRLNTGYWVHLAIINTNLKVLQWIKSTIKTGVIYTKLRTGQPDKKIYQLVWTRNGAKRILSQVLPYLKIKKKQAELCILFQNQFISYKGGKNTIVPKKVTQRRNKLHKKVKGLNHDS